MPRYLTARSSLHVRRYLASLVGALLVFYSTIIAFNFTVDPYGIYYQTALIEEDKSRPGRELRMREVKLRAIENVRPDSIILGTSRSNRAFNPQHKAFRGATAYNASLTAANIYEARQVLEYAIAVAPVRQVILAADFLMFNTSRLKPSIIEHEQLVPNGNVGIRIHATRLGGNLLSLNAIFSSIETIKRIEAPCPADQPFIAITGRWGFERIEMCGGITSPSKFAWVFGPLLRSDGFGDATYHQFSFVNAEKGFDSWIEYAKILRIAHENGIDLRIVIPPIHAWQLELIHAIGLWDDFEFWKAEMARLNEEQARQEAPFPIWDFAVYNEYTTEAVRTDRPGSIGMRWFVENSHMRPEFGDFVL